MILRCNLPGGRLSVVEDCLQGPQITITHDLVELLFCPDEGRGQPADHHLSVLPVSYAAGLDAHTGMRTLDDVGGCQATHQRRRQAQPVDGKAFLQAFQQAGRSRWDNPDPAIRPACECGPCLPWHPVSKLPAARS